MPGYNLQTYKQRFLQHIENRHGTDSSFTIPDSLIFSYLGEAYRIIQEEKELVLKTDAFENLESGVAAYDIPYDMTGWRVKTLFVKNSSGDTVNTPLTQITINEFQRRYGPGTSADTGVPHTFAIDQEVLRGIVLYPTPNYAASSGLIFSNVGIVGDSLFRIYNQTAITAAVLVGTTTVDLSAPVSGFLNVGDEFGVVPTTQTDGQNIPDDIPRKWFRISVVVSTTELTLANAYDLTSNETAARFILSQVPTIEERYSGVIGWAPVDFMLSEYYRSRDPQLSLILRAQFDRFVQNMTLDQAWGVDDMRPSPSLQVPFANRGF